ncbi:ANTAR domain-containing protein [Streptomyces sp. NPDC002935]|uniref:ANTAR domain-containing protein n=1 Tax=unclassified Streptomyces TaxID=2593676 RepID=UPI0033284689
MFAPALPEHGARPAGDGADWSDGGVRVAQVLADAAAVGLQNQRLHAQYRVLAGQLQTALGSRVRVEQARGMLAERRGTGVDQAFVALRRYARRQRLPLDEAARRVLDGTMDRDEPNA